MDVVCMLWRRPDRDPALLKKRYEGAAVRSLREMLARHSRDAVRLTCVTNLPSEVDGADEVVVMPDRVTMLPSQCPKLWLFSDEFARRFGVGRRFLFTDLDVVLVGDVRRLEAHAGPVRFRANFRDPADASTARWRPFPTEAHVAARRTPLSARACSS